mmetsp:Transcript_10845/g.32681  ORF Transcript_10845/g.32681 Transcript_10845/m.32681 type:complete len:281 (+) Transcript_10845:110-952(+)
MEQRGRESHGGGAAADAAAAASKNPPPPLPLPPGLSVQQLPQLLRPTGRRAALTAGRPNAGGGAAGRSVAKPNNSSSRAARAQLLQVCSTIPERRAEALEFLWQQRSDAELARNIEHTLANFDALMDQCDSLFQECVAEAAEAHAEAEEPPPGQPRIPAEQLHGVTQRLIDAFGCRDEPVLERIGHIYSTAASGGGGGVGAVEFRGYVASVLTQVLHELQVRPEKEAACAATAGGGPEQEDACAEDSTRRESEGELSVFEALQGLFSSAIGLYDSPQPKS